MILNFINDFFTGIYNGVYETLIEDQRWTLVVDGLKMTLEISFFAVLLGVALGVILALMRLSRFKILKGIAGAYIDVIRGTPMMTQLLIINSVVFASVNIDKLIVASIAFGLNSGAYVAEIIRAGILSIDKGQMEAGRSLGLKQSQTMRLIILPQAIKNILPALGNEFIVLIKETSVAGYIGAHDLNKAAEVITSTTYNAFYPLIIIAIIYFVIVKIISLLLKKLEKYLGKSDAR